MLEYTDPVHVSLRKQRELLNFALHAADRAGKVTLQKFRRDSTARDKGKDGYFDPATAADLGAELCIRRAIRAAYPDHGILGEELGHQAGNGLTWVVDAIDGTRAFLAGMLHWGVLLALFDGRTPILGVIHQPFTGEFFFAVGHTAWYRRDSRKTRLRVSKVTALDRSIVTTASLDLLRDPRDLDRFARLQRSAMLFRREGDCYGYALLAMGIVDVVVDTGMHAWDVQALMPVVTGSGGIITTVDGRDPSMGGFVVAAATPGLHASVLELLNCR